jgi:hypothetical protein
LSTYLSRWLFLIATDFESSSFTYFLSLFNSLTKFGEDSITIVEVLFLDSSGEDAMSGDLFDALSLFLLECLFDGDAYPFSRSPLC